MFPQDLPKALAVDQLEWRPFNELRDLFGEEAGCDEDPLGGALGSHGVAQGDDPGGVDRFIGGGHDAVDDVFPASNRLRVDGGDVDLPLLVAVEGIDDQAHLFQESDAEPFELLGSKSFKSLLLDSSGLIVRLLSRDRWRSAVDQENQGKTCEDGNRYQDEHLFRSSGSKRLDQPH